jgi:hypothetical protein
MFATSQQAHPNSPEELKLSIFAAFLSAARLNGAPPSDQDPQEQHLTLAKMLSLWPPGSTLCKFPCMSLKNSLSARKESMQLKDVASINMAKPLIATPEDIHTVPSKLLNSLCSSFMTLVNSRLRSSACALLQKARSMDEWKSKEMLMLTSMLVPHQRSRRQPVVISTAITSFRSLSLTATQLNANVAHNAASRTSNELILPLVFEAVIELKLMDTYETTVTVRAPGSLSGAFSPIMAGLLSEVDVSLETSALLDSLMDSARSVVKQTINAAVGLVNWEMNSSRREKHSPQRLEPEEQNIKLNSSSVKEKKEAEATHIDNNDEVALPRRICELAEFQAEPPNEISRSQSLLLDLNNVSNTTDEHGIPSIRIGDLFDILHKEQHQISAAQQANYSCQYSSSTASNSKRKSSLLCDRTSPNIQSRPLKKRVSFSMLPHF